MTGPGLKTLLEALVLVSPEPLSPERAAALLEGVPAEEIRAALEELAADCERPERGLRLLRCAGGWQLATKPEFDALVRKFLQIERRTRLSSAAVESLAAVAYHQPVTQAEISAIRGVDSSGTLKTLLEKRLLKIVGRKKAPGNPLIYRTTDEFLRYFGLDSLEDLPREEEIAKILREDGGPGTAEENPD